MDWGSVSLPYVGGEMVVICRTWQCAPPCFPPGDNSKERRRMGTVNRLQRAGIDAYDSNEGLN